MEVIRLGNYGTVARKGLHLQSGWEGEIWVFTEEGLLQAEALFDKLFRKH